jgi:hypothetical protein
MLPDSPLRVCQTVSMSSMSSVIERRLGREVRVKRYGFLLGMTTMSKVPVVSYGYQRWGCKRTEASRLLSF